MFDIVMYSGVNTALITTINWHKMPFDVVLHIHACYIVRACMHKIL